MGLSPGRMVRYGDLRIGSREGAVILNRAMLDRPDPPAAALWPSVAPADDADTNAEDDKGGLSSASPPDGNANGGDANDDDANGNANDDDEEVLSSSTLLGDDDSFCTAVAGVGRDIAPPRIYDKVSLLRFGSCSAKKLETRVMGHGVMSELFWKTSAGLLAWIFRVGRCCRTFPLAPLLDLLSVVSMSGDHARVLCKG